MEMVVRVEVVARMGMVEPPQGRHNLARARKAIREVTAV
jgi:hypothetical protein